MPPPQKKKGAALIQETFFSFPWQESTWVCPHWRSLPFKPQPERNTHTHSVNPRSFLEWAAAFPQSTALPQGSSSETMPSSGSLLLTLFSWEILSHGQCLSFFSCSCNVLRHPWFFLEGKSRRRISEDLDLWPEKGLRGGPCAELVTTWMWNHFRKAKQYLCIC